MSLKNFMSYEDAEEIFGEYAGEINQLKSGLTNYETQNDINLEVPNRKNVLPLDVSKMKVSNHTGTWNGNAYTVGGITFTLNITDRQIVSVVATGTAESVVTLNAYYNTEANPTEIEFDTDFILNGCPSDGGTETYLLRLWNVGGAVITDTGKGATLTKGTKINAFDIRIASGYECPSGGITFYPMLRPAFTDPTFTPYIPSVDARLEAVESGLDKLNGVTYSIAGNSDLDITVEEGGFYYLFTYRDTEPYLSMSLVCWSWYNTNTPIVKSIISSNSITITNKQNNIINIANANVGNVTAKMIKIN